MDISNLHLNVLTKLFENLNKVFVLRAICLPAFTIVICSTMRRFIECSRHHHYQFLMIWWSLHLLESLCAVCGFTLLFTIGSLRLQ